MSVAATCFLPRSSWERCPGSRRCCDARRSVGSLLAVHCGRVVPANSP
jgi:hypothetical protein